MQNKKILQVLGSKALAAILAGVMAFIPPVTTFAAESEQNVVEETTINTETEIEAARTENTDINDNTTDEGITEASSEDGSNASKDTTKTDTTEKVRIEPRKDDYYVLDIDKYNEALDEYKKDNPVPMEDDFVEFDEESYNKDVEEHDAAKPDALDYLTEEQKAQRLEDIESWKSTMPTKDQFTNSKEYQEDLEKYNNAEPENDESFSNQNNPDYIKTNKEYNEAKAAEEGRLMQENTVYYEDRYNEAVEKYNTDLETWNENAVEEGQDGYDEWIASKPVEPKQSDYTELDRDAVTNGINAWLLANPAPNYEDYAATNADGETFEEAYARWKSEAPNPENYFMEDAFEQAMTAYRLNEPRTSDYISDSAVRAEYNAAMSEWDKTTPSESDYKTPNKDAWDAAYHVWLAGTPDTMKYSYFDETRYNRDMALYMEYLMSLGKQNTSSSNDNGSSSDSESNTSATAVSKPSVTLDTIMHVEAGTTIDASTLKLGDTGYTVKGYMDALFAIRDIKDGSIPVGYAFSGLLDRTTVSQEFVNALSSMDTLDTVYLDTKTIESKATDQFGNVIYNYGKIDAMTFDSVVMMFGVTKTGDVEITQAYLDASTGNVVSIFRKDVVIMTPVAVIPA